MSIRRYPLLFPPMRWYERMCMSCHISNIYWSPERQRQNEEFNMSWQTAEGGCSSAFNKCMTGARGNHISVYKPCYMQQGGGCGGEMRCMRVSSTALWRRYRRGCNKIFTAVEINNSEKLSGFHRFTYQRIPVGDNKVLRLAGGLVPCVRVNSTNTALVVCCSDLCFLWFLSFFEQRDLSKSVI